jgi:hypothetical protein
MTLVHPIHLTNAVSNSEPILTQVMVDYDSSLRILHLPPSIQSFRESFQIRHLSSWLYCVRTANKGRPIIISSRVIEEYAEPNDTLHRIRFVKPSFVYQSLSTNS